MCAGAARPVHGHALHPHLLLNEEQSFLILNETQTDEFMNLCRLSFLYTVDVALASFDLWLLRTFYASSRDIIPLIGKSKHAESFLFHL